MEPTKGNFVIDVRDDGVFLTVTAGSDGNFPVEVGHVLDALSSRKIADYNRLAIEEAVLEKKSSPVRIADAQKNRPTAEISVVVSRDRMEAFLQVDLPAGAIKPDFEAVYDSLDKADVSYGILKDSIDAALRQPGMRVLCARGKLPEDGTDARISNAIDLTHRGRPAETEDGSVDFKNLGLFISVEKGQLLAEKIPATMGSQGMDVCGNPLPCHPGRDISFRPGANVEVIENSKLVAAASGNLMMIGDRLSISPILKINGDVGLSSGNINFAGDIVISGSVQEGFSVTAGGNIEVVGTVSGGSLQGNNITVRKGIIGLNKSIFTAAGTVAAKFVENARISADQDIVITDVVLHSQLRAGNTIRVEGHRGQIVGGIASAGEDILAKSAGSSSATPTDLQVGVNPKLREEYLGVRKELKAAESSLDQIQKGLFTMKSMDQALLTPEKKELLLKITRAHFTTLGQVEVLRKRMSELEVAYEELRNGQIRISDIIYPGVKITIGALVKPVQQEIRSVTYYADAGEIKLRPFK